MPRVSLVPFDKIDPELQKVMASYDEELGGSEFVRVYAHAPEVFKRFIAFYFPLQPNPRSPVPPGRGRRFKSRLA